MSILVSSAVGISCSAELSMKRVLYPQGPGLVQYTFKFKSFLPYGPMNFKIMKVDCIIWTDQHINIGTYRISTKAYLSHDVATWNDILPCNKIDIPLVVYRLSNITYLGAQWLSAWLKTEGSRVRASLASLHCGPWARHIYPSLVLIQPRKIHPCLTERL